jgi:chaperone required for assembly of F1-ATPase
MKRAYKSVTVAAVEGGHGVLLDDKPVRTPMGEALIAATPALAEAIATEWAAQAETVKPHSMPMTRLLTTALDRTTPDRARVLESMLGFAATDLICYRAEHPDELVRRQVAVWHPLVTWAAERFEAHLDVHFGVMPRPQPEAAVRALRRAVEGMDPLRLTGLAMTASAAGSLVIGLAVLDNHLTVEAAFAASQVDEMFQVERWGEDDEAADHRAQLLEDFRDTGRFLTLIKA